MDRLPLHALRALSLVRAHGGIRAAARALGVSHSAVSRQLKELEHSVGIRLFERDAARTLRLSAQGLRLSEVVGKAIQDIEQALEAVREPRSRNSVSVSTTPSLAARWLLPRLPLLQRQYPHLEVSVIVDQRVEEAGLFTADLAIRMGSGSWPGFVADVLMNDCLYPVMSPAQWREAGRPGSLEDLRQLRLLHDRDPYTSWQRWREKYGPAELDVRRGPRFASSDLVLRAAVQGLGVALARDRLVQADLAAGTLIRLFGARQVDLGDAYWIVRPASGPLREAARLLSEWLRREGASRTGRGHPT